MGVGDVWNTKTRKDAKGDARRRFVECGPPLPAHVLDVPLPLRFRLYIGIVQWIGHHGPLASQLANVFGIDRHAVAECASG